MEKKLFVQIRLRILDGGGVDAGRYGPDCTHVIVDKAVYVNSWFPYLFVLLIVAD